MQQQFAETGDGLVMREIAWNDLVARLDAARELRKELDGITGAPGGGFDQFAKLACTAKDKGKRTVNRNALGAGKVDQAQAQETAMSAAQDSAQGD